MSEVLKRYIVAVSTRPYGDVYIYLSTVLDSSEAVKIVKEYHSQNHPNYPIQDLQTGYIRDVPIPGVYQTIVI